MKKSSLLASAAALSMTMAAAPVFAQGGPFADVPTDHWAYASVDKLQKRGIVIGYPDQTYGGKRSMTRYEFAIAIARLLDTVGTAQQVDLSNYVTKGDLQNQLGNYALKSDLAGFATKADVDTLRRLVSEFQTELTTLGVDLDAVKKRLDTLEGRVAKIEDELKKMVRVTGDFNVYSRSNNRFKTDINPALGAGTQAVSVRDANGFQVTGGFGSRGGFLADTRVFHDLDLNIRAQVSDKAVFDSSINFGNYLSFLNSIGSFSGVRSDRGPSPNGVYTGQKVNQDQIQTVYKAMIDAQTRVPVLGNVSFQAGRVPFQLTPYTLKLIDVDYYFDNAKTDNGNIPLDGIKGNLNVGPFGVTAFAVKVDPIRFLSNASGAFPTDGNYGLFAGAGRGAYGGPLRAQSRTIVDPYGRNVSTGNRPVGSLINPASNGAMSVEQMAGARVAISRKGIGTLGGTYIYMSGSPTVRPENVDPNGGDLSDNLSFDRVAVYGGDFEGYFGSIGVYASYTKSDTGGNRVVNGVVDGETRRKLTEDNDAWDAGIKLGNQSALTANVGYREIAPYFAAPGYWGRVGSLTNPVDVKGVYGTLNYRLSKFVSAVAGAHFYEGTGDAVNNGGLSDDDKITNYRVGLRYGFSQSNSVDFGVDWTAYDILRGDLTGRVKPNEIFYNLGFGYLLTPQTGFKVVYQIINYDDKDSGFDTINGNGGVLTSTFTVRF
ncbi:MAG: S-layer homology domain-containing protein [Capsulimonadales bacterium]|nr:S-layer homology domain-containing protein [Capsulimonadales bacterium]